VSKHRVPALQKCHSQRQSRILFAPEEFGMTHGGFRTDMTRVRDRKRAMVGGLDEM
jgi:hypothetical protein